MTDPFPYEAVLWDIDGTLADGESVHEKSFLKACEALGVILPDRFQDQLLGCAESVSYTWLVQTCGLNVSFNDWTNTRYIAPIWT